MMVTEGSQHNVMTDGQSDQVLQVHELLYATKKTLTKTLTPGFTFHQ